MLYMPATTSATPVVLQQAMSSAPLQSTSQYYMLQSAPMIPAVPVFNTTYVYPRYGFVPRPVETSVNKDEIEKCQTTQLVEVAQPIQHVVHHHIQSHGHQTCPGYCDLCCPWIDNARQHQQRSSRRDQFERDELEQVDSSKGETIDDKIDRIRRELRQNSSQQSDKSTETIEHHIHYPRSRSRSRSSSAPRGPWRSSNQNEYTWRDSHLPAYREATLARSQTPVDETRTWNETAHQRSHRNTRSSTSCSNKNDYIYRPKSDTEARKWYTQTTGKDADREVHQALRGGTTTYAYAGAPTPPATRTTCDHSFYADVPATTKTHTLKKIDSTQHHDLYASNHSSLHVIPKHGTTMDPPYMRIVNAPVTYIH